MQCCAVGSVFRMTHVRMTHVRMPTLPLVQGDMEDREKLRAKAVAERKLAKVQQEADKLAAEAEVMARMGLSYDDIIKVRLGWGDLSDGSLGGQKNVTK